MFAELYECVVGPNTQHGVNEGVYLLSSQAEGTTFPMFAEYKRRLTEGDQNQIAYVLMKGMPFEMKPWFMKVSDKCPWKNVQFRV